MRSDKRNYKGNGFAGRNEAWSQPHTRQSVSLSISPSTEPDLDVMVFSISNYSLLSVTFTSSFLSEKYQFPFVPMRIGACVNSVHVPRLIAACLLSALWSWIASPPTLSQTFFFFGRVGVVGGWGGFSEQPLDHAPKMLQSWRLLEHRDISFHPLVLEATWIRLVKVKLAHITVTYPNTQNSNGFCMHSVL